MHHQGKFDAIRGISAIVVFGTHIWQAYWWRFYPADHIGIAVGGTLGRHAVLVFFMLSGFLITTSIYENKRRNGEFVWSDYLLSRFARIYPPFLASLALAVVVGLVISLGALPGGTAPYGLSTDSYTIRQFYNVPFTELVQSALMLGGMTGVNGALWTLYLEFWLYIAAMFVAIALTVNGRGRRVSMGVFAVLAMLIPTFINRSFPFFCVVWGLGATSAVLVRSGVSPFLRTFLRSSALIVGSGLVYLAFFYPAWLGAAYFAPNFKHSGFVVQLAFCIVYAYVIFFASFMNRDYPATIRITGDFSYSLYILHFPILLLGLSLFQTWMGASLGRTLIISVLIAFFGIGLARISAKYLECASVYKKRLTLFLDRASGLLWQRTLDIRDQRE